MGVRYKSIEELYEAFDIIEKIYNEKIELRNKNEIIYKFEKEKLRFMIEQVAKGIHSENIVTEQNKEIEIQKMKKIFV